MKKGFRKMWEGSLKLSVVGPSDIFHAAGQSGIGGKSLDTGLPVPNSQGKLMCPRGSRPYSVYGVQRLQGVPLAKGAQRFLKVLLISI